MSATIDQKAYLQKYLGGSSKDKKKKKKKAIIGKGFKIIDDDIDLSKLRPLEGDEIDLLDEGEDAPQIAGIVDERPDEVKNLEKFKTTSKWKVVNQDDGFNCKLQIEEIKQDIKEVEKENELIFGKMYSDSEDESKNDSDASPSRQTSKIDKSNASKMHGNDSDNSPRGKADRKISQSLVRKKEIDDADPSPPRKSSKVDRRDNSKKHNSDSDFSPPRKRDRQIAQSPERNRRVDSDSDLSPTRKHENRPKNKQRKASRWGDFDNQDQLDNRKDRSPNLKTSKTHNRSDSDQSPPRKSRRDQNNDQRDGRNVKTSKRTESFDSDASPPRRKKHSPQRFSQSTKYDNKNERINRDQSGEKYRRSITPNKSLKKIRNDSDQSFRRGRSVSPNKSPKRKNRYPDNERRFNIDQSRIRSESNERHRRYTSTQRRQSTEKNDSKDRHERYNLNQNKSVDLHQSASRKRSPARSKERYSDSDQSPPRRKDNRRNNESSRQSDNHRKDSESPPPSNRKMAKTLEGKKAGLQDAKQLREENEQFRRKENEVFSEMADEVSGRNAQVVSRRRKRDTSEERHKQKEKAERQKEIDAKYQKWNRGLKQTQDQEARVQDYLHEASKPLARFKDDKDLETSLRDVERAGDPMLNYMRNRKRERGDLPTEKPSYKGSFPPNRFNIRPGYRWDGVDRSNGYEKKYFEQQSKKKAQEEEAYKWSTEDL